MRVFWWVLMSAVLFPFLKALVLLVDALARLLGGI
jgi:hypothetical protein